jgi:general stress protein 26
MIKFSSDLQKKLEGSFLVLATVNNENKPHVIAMTCYKVLTENIILLCDTYLQETLINIKHNSRVSLLFVSKDKTGYEFSGQAKYLEAGEEVELCKELKGQKGLICKGALIVEVDRIFISRNKK